RARCRPRREPGARRSSRCAAWEGCGSSSRVRRPSLAELDVVDVLRDRRLLPADRALGIAAQRDLAELRREGVEQQEPPGERLARVSGLALEVGLGDGVVGGDAEPADGGGCEIEGGGGAEAGGADEQHARVEQLQLALLADLGDEQVPAVPLPLRAVEGARKLRREAVPLPVGEAAGEVDHVLVAELLERLGRET